MNTRFAPILAISATHAYDATGDAGVEFVMLGPTASILNQGRALARVRGGTLCVLAELDESGDPISTMAGRTLLVGMRGTTGWFAGVTAPVIAEPKRTPLYTNSAGMRALGAPVAAVVAGGMLPWMPVMVDRPLTLRLVGAGGARVQERVAGVGAEGVVFDLRGVPDGLYGVAELGGTVQAPAVVPLVVCGGTGSTAVWGIVAVTIDAGFYQAPAAFSVALGVREEPLKYFVVAPGYTPSEMMHLAVADRGFKEEDRAEVAFDRVLPAAFEASDLTPEVLGADPAHLVMFRSRVSVARRARGMRKLQLSRNGTVLVENLPMPTPDRPRSDLIVHLSKP